MKRLTVDEAKELLGEGFHKAFRVMGNSYHANDVYSAITNMNPHEWDNVLSFLVLSLQDMGIHLTKE
jgi:hypothetical protein